MMYFGIDPGVSGGLASLNDTLTISTKMPSTERDIWDWLQGNAAKGGPRNDAGYVAVLERVGGFIKGDHHPFMGAAMFKFGQSYGFLRGCLIAAGIPFEETTPRTWQKALGMSSRKKGETRTSFKNRLKAMAQQFFPREKVTLATADALLIALYCKRKHEGTL